ncbi:VOC family protein [Longimicrobium sp.]|uniref:VOC family protein n=1 Tax=Longimicrobium sp. TaxID=2029185 RepID=UPI002F92BAD8
MNLNQVTLPAVDLAASVAFYRTLGFRLIVDTPHYARFECPEAGATFSLHVVDTMPADSGILVYFEHEALDELVADLKGKGVVFTQEPTDQRWLWREARLRDPAGNALWLYWAGENRRNPPWRVANP